MLDRRQFLVEAVLGAGAVTLAPMLKLPAEVKQLEPEVIHLGGNLWRAKFIRADVPNSNKHLYPADVLGQAIQRYRDDIAHRCGLGQLGMPNDCKIHLADVSHQVRAIQGAGDGYLTADIETLDILQGRQLARLLSSGHQLVAFRTAGIGSYIEDSNGVLRIGKDYRLVSINAVMQPMAVTL